MQEALDVSLDAARYAALEGPLKEIVDRYAFIDQEGNRVVCWDHAKYVNHCCRASTLSTGYGFEIAIRDIRAGEQVTDDYGLFNLPFGMDFSCDNPECRGRVSRRDIDRRHAAPEASIIASLAPLDKVPRALLPYPRARRPGQAVFIHRRDLGHISVLETQYSKSRHIND